MEHSTGLCHSKWTVQHVAQCARVCAIAHYPVWEACHCPTAWSAMYFDRFDILAAHYQFWCDHHGGQWSDGYARIGRILNMGFRPGPCFSWDSLGDNGQEIYRQLCERHGFAVPEEA